MQRLHQIVTDSGQKAGLGEVRALGLATRLVETLSEPVPIDGREATVGASVGIALTPAESTTGDQVTALGPVGERLLEAADTALYQAKAEGKGRWVIAEN